MLTHSSRAHPVLGQIGVSPPRALLCVASNLQITQQAALLNQNYAFAQPGIFLYAINAE